MPDVILIGGANGPGKTTFAREVLRVLHPGADFLNADEIQKEGAEFAHPIAAGRELLRRLADLEARRASLAVETTLSSRMYLRRLRGWMGAGYSVTLHFIELPSAEYAIQRVARRVAVAGHSVPDADVRRRFSRGLELFRNAYSREVEHCFHWFSDDEGLRIVERRQN